MSEMSNSPESMLSATNSGAPSETAQNADGQDFEGTEAEQELAVSSLETDLAPVTKTIEIPVSLPVHVTGQDHLNQILEAHERWISAVLNPKAPLSEGRANVKGADLTAMDLSGRDLRGANLSQAVLSNANLQHANLNGANLSGANLVGARLDHASLKRTKLDGADLTDAVLLGADLSQASVTNAQGITLSDEPTSGNEFSVSDAGTETDNEKVQINDGEGTADLSSASEAHAEGVSIQ